MTSRPDLPPPSLYMVLGRQPTLRECVQAAHAAVQDGQRIAYAEGSKAGWRTRGALNRVQTILIKLLVHAKDVR